MELLSQPAKRLRLTEEGLPEDELHAMVAKCLRVVLAPPAMWTTFPAGGYGLSEAAKARLARLGCEAGWPDIQIVCAGRIYGIELKRPGGRLTQRLIYRTKRGTLRIREGQADMFPRLEAAGMKIAVCRSLAEVLAALKAWRLPLRLAPSPTPKPPPPARAA